MDIIVKSWIYDTISVEPQGVTRRRVHMACDTWLALENMSISTRETCALHIDASFRNFIQGDLFMNDYCQKMKGFTDSSIDFDVPDHILVLNILRGLNKNYDHLHAIFMHVTPFPSFQKVHDNLCLEEIQQGVQGL
jgi:hypothetical protein